nr:MAG TPA: hypothetical protein [Caudoviricetes sp.]
MVESIFALYTSPSHFWRSSAKRSESAVIVGGAPCL